jgi:uncharacterized protein involved in exopolysaccharide biosynthesis
MIPADGPSKPLIHARPTTPLHDHSQGALALNGAFPPAHYLPLPAPTGLSGPPTLGALLVALKRRWFAAGAMAILAAIGAVVVIAYIFPPKYVSQARLELASRPARPLLVQHSGDHEVDVNTYRANQQAIIKSPLVLSSALNNEKLKGLPIAGRSPESLEKSLKVDFAQGPEIMTIKLLGDEPDYLADLLNAVIQAYIKEIEARDNQRRVKVIGDLDKSLQENKKKLAEKRIEVGKAERDEKIPDPVSQQAAYQALAVQKHGTETSLRNVRDDLSNKNLEIMAKKAQLENIDLQPDSTAKLRQL